MSSIYDRNKIIIKSLVVMLVLLVVIPSFASANDAYRYDYDSEYLKITVTRIDKEMAIGEDYSFKVTMTNTSEWELNLSSIEDFIFSGNKYIHSVSIKNIAPEADRSISPGEELTVTLTTEIPYNISWYKQNGEYYYDLALTVNYTIYFSDEEDDSIGCSSVDEPISIKINNLYDGSEYLSMEYFRDIDDTVLERDWTNLNYEEYTAFQKTTVSVCNISGITLENLIVHAQYDSSYPVLVNEAEGVIFSPSDRNDITLSSYYSVILEDLPDSIVDRYQTIFTVDGQYYTVGLEKDINMLIAIVPEFDCAVEANGDDLIVTLINDTGYRFSGFYFGEALSKSSSKILLEDDAIISVFKNGRTKEFTVAQNDDNTYTIGYMLGDYFCYWKAVIKIYSDGEARISMYDDCKYSDYIFLSDITPTPIEEDITPTPQTAEDASPTVNRTPAHYSPTPTPEATETPAATPLATNTVGITAEPTSEPAFEITDIQKSSSIPLWVWITLGDAVIATLFIIVILKKIKGLKSENE